jgi:hypothetical protein
MQMYSHPLDKVATEIPDTTKANGVLLELNSKEGLTLPARLRAHFKTSRFPVNFQEIFVLAIEQWLWEIDPLTVTEDPLVAMSDPVILQVATHQREIGWNKLMRGFISIKWYYLIDPTTPSGTSGYHKKAVSRAFSLLIEELWASQLDFWRDYQAERHQNPTPDVDLPSPHVQELQASIQHLHSLKTQVETNREDVYFPRDVKEFMESNNPRQLHNYILNYGPAIRQSIHRRTSQARTNTRPLWHFPGFSRRFNTILPGRTLNPTPNPYSRSSTNHPTGPSHPDPIHIQHDTGATFPHKHSRWKITQQIRDRFQQFFTPK